MPTVYIIDDDVSVLDSTALMLRLLGFDARSSCFTTQFAALFDADAVQYAQPSVTKVGGITEFRRIAVLAAERGVKLAPHSPYFGPGALATLHLIAALAPEARFEYFYLQVDAWLFGGRLTPARGALEVPQEPGLGADPDPDVIRRYRVE